MSKIDSGKLHKNGRATERENCVWCGVCDCLTVGICTSILMYTYKGMYGCMGEARHTANYWSMSEILHCKQFTFGYSCFHIVKPVYL